MRNLASVCSIEKVWELEGKDKVQGASMVENSYEAMVSKDIKVGQLVAFIQEGAILPVKENWEWLRKRCYKENVNGFVIKPMKFASIKSWGLIVPLNELGLDEKIWKKFKAGEDITDILEIRKYEPEEDASPKKEKYPKWVKFCLSHLLTRWIGRIWQKKHQSSSGGFPSDLISKSDETTLQNMKGVLEKYAEKYVYTSVKLEGKSFTVVPVFKGKKLVSAYPCSRNNAYKLPDNSIFWTVMNEKKIVQKMKEVFAKTGKAYIIQGEQVGVGIQQNIYNFSENDWYVYTVKDYNTGKQLNVDDAVNACKELGLNFVPIIQKNVKLKDIMPDVETAVKYAENKFWKPNEFIYIPNKNEKIWKDYFQHEGVVVRTMDYDKDNNVGCSFKVKNSDYASKGLSEINQLAKKSMTVR